MAKTDKAQNISFEVEMVPVPFGTRMFFNQFQLEKIGDFIIIHFAAVIGRRFLENVFSCAVDQHALTAAKQTLMDYVGRSGDLKPIDRVGNIVSAEKVDIANLISAAHTGDVAETILINYSAQETVEARKRGDSKVRGEPVAILRSTLAVQQTLLMELFQED